MSLSTSRQQFLAYESNGDPDIQYGRRGGIFISTCICICFVIFAVLAAVLVGVIVYFVTYFKVSQSQDTEFFWDEEVSFGEPTSPSPDLRLPLYVVPSFYRLKLKTDLDNSNFTGEVYITIKASKRVKEIILHSKDLHINSNARLTEQIYEDVESGNSRMKRDVESNDTSLDTTTESITDITTSNVFNSDNSTEAPLSTETPLSTEVPSNGTEPPIIDDARVTHSNVRNIKIISITQSTGDRLILTLASALTPNVDYTLELSFEGQITNSLNGFYKSSYVNNNSQVRQLGVTQFEPISARAAFPCFDEPAFKAKFEISIAHPQNITVLSNMKVAAQESMPENPNWQWTHFDRSVNMSTYLVAYVLSDFQNLETSYVSKDNVTKIIRVWTRPELISKAKYALSIVPKLLAYYEDVFGLPYVLDKLDLIGIPDYATGAMENWGLITFRETTLLFAEKENSPREKQNVAIDIAHELAHQWFGNLVTMKWWTDLWLNEGFATYIEYVGVNHIEPEWDMFESFTRDKMELLRSDALKNTSPVSRQVVAASEIAQKFDEISYTKGANLIRMLNHTISEKLFLAGLAIYLNKWKYQNAEENDLWEAMSEATRDEPMLKDLNVVQFMNSWTRQAGYPVVIVHRDYETGYVTFEQKLFSNTQTPHKSMSQQLWSVPLSYAAVGGAPDAGGAPGAGGWSTAPRLWLQDRTMQAKIDVNETQALYVNVDAIGYYRVNYDKRNWELLAQALKSGLIQAPLTKAQLIDDAFNFAKSGQLDYSYALGLTTCVIGGEDSKVVWDMLLNNMAFLHFNLKSTAGYVYFQDYMRLMLRAQLEKLEYGLRPPRDDNEAFLAENLVMWECIAESPRCLRWARDQFDAWVARPDLSDNPIPSHLRPLVYNMAVKHGGRREFEFFWRLFLNASDPSVRNLALSNLPSTKDEPLIALLLEKSLNEIPKQYAAAAWMVEPPVATRVAQNFLVDRFDEVYSRFNSMDPFTFASVVNGAFGTVSRQDDLEKLKKFAVRHADRLAGAAQTLQKVVDGATLRIAWTRRHAAEVARWLKDYVTEHASSVDNAWPDLPLTQNIIINIASGDTANETVNDTVPTNGTSP